MRPNRSIRLTLLAAAVGAMIGTAGAQTSGATGTDQSQLEQLKRQLAEQMRRIEELKRAVAAEEAGLNDMRRRLDRSGLESQRGGADATTQAGTQPVPVGQAPAREGRAPEVAPIFDQPGVLTPKGRFVLEPSLQYSYSSSNRIALVG